MVVFSNILNLSALDTFFRLFFYEGQHNIVGKRSYSFSKIRNMIANSWQFIAPSQQGTCIHWSFVNMLFVQRNMQSHDLTIWVRHLGLILFSRKQSLTFSISSVSKQPGSCMLEVYGFQVRYSALVLWKSCATICVGRFCLIFVCEIDLRTASDS